MIIEQGRLSRTETITDLKRNVRLSRLGFLQSFEGTILDLKYSGRERLDRSSHLVTNATKLKGGRGVMRRRARCRKGGERATILQGVSRRVEEAGLSHLH